MMHALDRLKRTIHTLLRDKSLLDQCGQLTPKEIADLAARRFREHNLPVRVIEVTPLAPDQECRYCISYELEETGTVRAQRFARRIG